MNRSPPDERVSDGLAITLSGGGARAAYQVGLLRCLGHHFPNLRIPIVTGVSAGAINAACLAAHSGPLSEAAERLTSLWCGLEVDEVFRVDSLSLGQKLVKWGWRLVSGGGVLAPEVRSLVDTTPLRRYLTQALELSKNGEIPGIADNLERGALEALAIISSNFSTGQSVTWVQGCDIEGWERPDRRSRKTRITVDHVLASSALPFFFPAVQIGNEWHGDGGIRLTAPLAPALHLGAERILAISTRHKKSIEEADRAVISGYPPPLQVASQLLNAVFLDVLDQDALRIEAMNELLEELPPSKRKGREGIRLVVVRPSRDLAALARELEPDLPKLLRHLIRSLGSRDTASPDLLSLVMFQREYLRRLIEIGEEDAESRAEEIRALVEG